MRRTASVLLSAVAAACFCNSAPGQNLFTNPSFETGDFTGWTKTGGGTLRTFDGVFMPRTGQFGIDRGPSGTLSQTVTVQPGTTYEVGLWMSFAKDDPAGGNAALGGGFSIDRDGQGQSPDASYFLETRVPGYQRVRQLIAIPPGQTSPSIRFTFPGIFISGRHLAADDFYMMPFTPLGPATPAPRVFVDGSPIQGGGTITNVTQMSLANDGRLLGAMGNGAVVRQADGTHTRITSEFSSGAVLSPGGGTAIYSDSSAGFSRLLTCAMVSWSSTRARTVAARRRRHLVFRARFLCRRRRTRGFNGLSSSTSGIYRSNGSGLAAPAVQNMTNELVAVRSVGGFSQNNAGLVAFDASVTPPGAPTFRSAIYVNDGTSTMVRVAKGDAAPGTGHNV